MKIETLYQAQAHFKSEVGTLIIEADVNINNNKAVDISNGHVYQIEDDVTTTVADFSNYPGANHRTHYGEPTLDEQFATMTAIDTFCNDITDKTYQLEISSNG